MSKVQIVFPGSATNLVGWTVSTVLSVTPGYVGLRWGERVDTNADLVIFIADTVNLIPNPIRTAVRAGLTVFVVTGLEATVSPKDLADLGAGAKIYFFHAKRHAAGEGFLAFAQLSAALQRVLTGQSLDDLGKE